jgi:L-Ala-D/L-Glu epimerase
MGPGIHVRRITAADTAEIRWAVLRPGFPRETAIFAGDEDQQTIHLGVFLGERLAGVASLYEVEPPAEIPPGRSRQLRGMATMPDVRGMGCGQELLKACEAQAKEAGCELLWCNARQTAVGFYERAGWRIIGAEFDIPTVGPHFRMVRPLGQLLRQAV